MLIKQPCPSPFDIEDPVHFEIKLMFGKALAKALGPCQKWDARNEISYWWAELDGIPLMLRIQQDGKCFVTYDRNDAERLGSHLNAWLDANIVATVKELPPKLINHPFK